MANWLRTRLSKGNLLIKRLRITIFCLNLFFVILGFLVLTIGIFTYVEYQQYREFLGDHLGLHGIGLIIVGCVTFVITLLCFIGKIRKSPCVLLYFMMVLVVIYLFEIACGIAVIVEKSKLDATLTKNLNKIFNDYKSNEGIWEHLQTEMKCCGINGPDDWHTNIPKSCYETLPKGQRFCTKTGCKSPLLNHFGSIAAISAGFSLSFGLIQILVIGCTFYAYKLFRDSFGEHIEIFVR
ncbi:leukocyte surface antigen CD53-like isoform X2 [Sitodiplosis mosellana]|uniref:leukocyte surface antigen CD53-like isoform X2 n=1 Tax=Sitodiplosis mosellana TaxID=263140 RepID=UPI0024446001|nr:leukocyte surface antigen CD53-like isoform X2 [Sitodiplosis mosellana]